MAPKGKPKKAASRKKAPRSHQRDVELYKRQFLAHKWSTLRIMAADIGVPESTVRKWAAADADTGMPAWLDARKALDRQASERADELMVQSTAERIVEMRERHLQVARDLFFKSSNQLLGKVKNPETGQMEVPRFESESQALQGLRLAMAAEQSLLLRKQDPDAAGGPNFNGPTQILLGGGSQDGNAARALREVSETELLKIIDMDKGSDGAGNTKKDGGKGASGAQGGAPKRR
jgi:hypothetical protein